MLKDRVSTNTNRRRIDVVNTSYKANGDINNMTVDIFRLDSNISEPGTKLNASELTDAMVEAINQQCFGVKANNTKLTWFQYKGSFRSNVITISYEGPLCYAKFPAHSYLTGSISGTNITIRENSALNALTGAERRIDYYIELYTDSSLTKLLTRLKHSIIYIPQSTNPND